MMTTKQWSAQQEAIFNWFATGTGHLVVRARAGTGKTTTIIEATNHAPENRILLAAFNKKIAQELTQRLRNPKAEAKTLHGVGFSCVLRNWNGVQVDEERGMRLARKVVTDDVPDEIVALIKKLASRCKGTCPFPRDVEELIEEAEDADLVPDEQYEENGWNARFVAEKAMAAMELACQRDNTIDFDDMVFVPLRNKWVFGRWELVVVDEAQDMNAAQLLLAQRSCKRGGLRSLVMIVRRFTDFEVPTVVRSIASRGRTAPRKWA
jgi:DNA helicase-2/ATP-dependent DNA helicase PcrA